MTDDGWRPTTNHQRPRTGYPSLRVPHPSSRALPNIVVSIFHLRSSIVFEFPPPLDPLRDLLLEPEPRRLVERRVGDLVGQVILRQVPFGHAVCVLVPRP